MDDPTTTQNSVSDSNNSSTEDYSQFSQAMEPVTVPNPTKKKQKRKKERPDPLSHQALFHIASDLPPEAFIPTRVGVHMYPTHLRLLVSTILELTDNQSNVAVPKNVLKKIIKAAMDDMRARQVRRPFKTFDKLLKRAWIDNAVRYSPGPGPLDVFLINTRSVIEALSSRSARPILTDADGENSESDETTVDEAPTNLDLAPHHRQDSPFLPLVSAIARLGGSIAGNRIPLTDVRHELGGEPGVRTIGFVSFRLYIKEATRAGLVTKQGKGVGRTLCLQSDRDQLRVLLVRSEGVVQASN